MYFKDPKLKSTLSVEYKIHIFCITFHEYICVGKPERRGARLHIVCTWLTNKVGKKHSIIMLRINVIIITH